MDLSESVYKLSEGFPHDEKFGLKSNSKGEFKQFLGISIGSLFELETQLLLAVRFNYLKEINHELESIDSLRKMLFGLQRSLS